MTSEFKARSTNLNFHLKKKKKTKKEEKEVEEEEEDDEYPAMPGVPFLRSFKILIQAKITPWMVLYNHEKFEVNRLNSLVNNGQ